MATIDIVFNDKTYSIEESAFEAAAAALRTHFLSAMSGSGASINLGGTTYNIDSTKLSAATTNFVTHLGKISGSGSKVTVGGVEYPFAPSKVQDAIADLEVVLGDLVSGGNEGSSEELVFAEQTVEFEDLFDGLYMNSIAFTPVLGETYRVVWDGQEYVLTAHEEALDGGDISSTHVYLGNITIFTDGDDTGEPFLIMTGNETSVMTYDTASSHTVAIYKVSGGNGGSSSDLIFENANLSGFEALGSVCYSLNLDTTIELVVGETYKVVWDGQEFNVQAKTLADSPCIGNLNIVNQGDNTGEPFLIGAGANIMSIYTKSTASNHSVAIYKVAGGNGGSDNLGEVVLAETVLNDFEEQTNVSDQLCYNTTLNLDLAEGQIYRVVWDGKEYFVDAAADDDGVIFIGNFAILFDYNSTNYNTHAPFLIATNNEGITELLTPEAGSHTIAIYKVDGAVLMPTQVHTSGYNSAYGLYSIDCWTDDKHLTIGSTYRVIWDGVSYDCIAEDASSILDGAVIIGNGSIFGLNGNNEPFVIGWTLDGAMFVNINDTEETNHSFAVYDLSTPSSNLGEEVLAEQTVSVEYYEPEQNYIGYFENPPILVVGETYIVILDGVKYECTALDFSSLMVEGAVGLNFNDGWGIVTYDGQAAIMINDTEPTTHSIAIYKVAPDSSNDSPFILEQQQFTGFEFNDYYGAYISIANPDLFKLTVGESYEVVWDGNSYVCVAQDASFMEEGAVMVGNGSSVGLNGNNEPFAIGCAPSGIVFMAADDAASHTCAIIRGVVLREKAYSGFVNKNLGGTPLYDLEVDFALVNGETYNVAWDGELYTLTANDYGGNAICLGNLNIVDKDDPNTGEPFLFANISGMGNHIYTTETEESHIIGLYKA